MAGLADVTNGDPRSWEKARELGKQLALPTGPYEARVPTADEMNAVLPYIMDRMARFAREKYFCENAEITFAHILGINAPRYGFPDSSGYNAKSGRNIEGFNRDGYDPNGFNKDGLDRYGFNRDGYDKNGYNRDGFDKYGFNAAGRDYYGNTREQLVTKEVTGWSDEFAAAIAAHLAQLEAAKEPPAEVMEAVAEAPTKKTARQTPPKKTAAGAKKGTVKKAVPAKAGGTAAAAA
jgi:hypothetical protein